MKPVLTASEFVRSFSDIVNRVVYRGEEFVVERNGQPAFQITRATGSDRRCTAADFDALFSSGPHADPAFADDLEAVVCSQPDAPAGFWE
jgi:hypothetical protein